MQLSTNVFSRAGESPHAKQIARWFGLTDAVRDPHRDMLRGSLPADVLPGPGEIVLLTGASGAGKSSVLRLIGEKISSLDRRVDLNGVQLPERPIVDLFAGAPLPQVLGLLSRVGLAEAWSFLRSPAELSEGQRWRLKLALAIFEAGVVTTDRKVISLGALSDAGDGTTSSGLPTLVGYVPKTVLVADEFCAVLDRVTAAVVARMLRRTVDAMSHVAAIVATSHDDLTAALRPDRIVRCDFGKIEIEHRKLSR